MTEWDPLYRQAMAETDPTKLQESINLAKRAMSDRERELSKILARVMQEQMSIREAKQGLELLAQEGVHGRDSDVA
ncbi:MAG: hypothetical protein DMG89_24375 [Acidobacteria bacterium]|nr:MAG: hypothetical protein DMG89_24375 [Acidobacteriota bacterium]